jgi:hypothetical protein
MTPLTQRDAVLTDYGISETKNGDPQVFLTFEVEPEGRLSYFGSLKGGALQFTIGALAALGYKGKDMSDLANGVDGRALQLGTRVSVAISDDDYPGHEGQKKINFVNAPGSGIKRADPVTAKARLKALGVEAELAKYRNANGIVAKPNDDIPF